MTDEQITKLMNKFHLENGMKRWMIAKFDEYADRFSEDRLVS